jgi:hypothetical protein
MKATYTGFRGFSGRHEHSVRSSTKCELPLQRLAMLHLLNLERRQRPRHARHVLPMGLLVILPSLIYTMVKVVYVNWVIMYIREK